MSGTLWFLFSSSSSTLFYFASEILYNCRAIHRVTDIFYVSSNVQNDIEFYKIKYRVSYTTNLSIKRDYENQQSK